MKTNTVKALWRTGGGLAALGLLLIILVAANVIVGRARWRTDLTSEKLYTLSDGTRQILQKLDKPVTLKLFFSRSAPEVPVHLKAYASQVEDLLHEYRNAGGQQVTIEVIDPKPDSEAEEWAQSYGVTAQNMDVFGQPVFFGIVAVAGETEGVIAALDPRTDSLLEYNLTRLIYRVTHPQRPVIGVMSSLPVMGEEAPPYGMPSPKAAKPWLAFQQLQEDYELRKVDTDVETIPDDLQALVVVHPKELPEKTLYAIDQFVLRGGHLLAFLDPMNVADLESDNGQNQFGRMKASSTLGPLLTAWGIGFDDTKVVADMKSASRLRGADNRVEDSPVFLTLRAANVSKDDILTSRLNMLMLPFAGSFVDQTQGKLTVTPLLTSSDMSGLVPAMTAQFGADSVNREFKPEAKLQNMAVRVSGTFHTAFPDGKPAAPPAGSDTEKVKPEDATAAALQEGKSTIILVADADLLYDRFCVEELNFFGARAFQPLNDNVNFFANAVEQVAGSSDLIGIRSRGEFFRPFDRVVALEEQARQRWHEKEQDLVGKLQAAREQLSKLQNQKADGQQFILSPEQKDAIARYKQDELRITRELKDVRKNLRQEIETLGVKVKVANIVLMPLLISIGGVAYGLRRRRR
ncbi:MAG: Gldg family protein [Lentisphaerae bacterium]|nr:Gldg family protein [Lentisphaerota bacterium]